MWKLYDEMIRCLPAQGQIASLTAGKIWNLVRTDNDDMGLAMTTAGDSRPRKYASFSGLSLHEAACQIRSWNLEEASAAMAAINACYNTPERLDALHCREPYENYCTRGIDFRGKTVGLVGHLHLPEALQQAAREVYTLERSPHPGDYPDSACEYLLPQCDIVLITGSSLINKTLPRLLTLCKNAYTIVTGPTVPLCPALLDCGIDRLAGMVVNRATDIETQIAGNRVHSPYPYGSTFLLSR